MFYQDSLINDTLFAKNDLESYIYNTRNNLNEFA